MQPPDIHNKDLNNILVINYTLPDNCCILIQSEYGSGAVTPSMLMILQSSDYSYKLHNEEVLSEIEINHGATVNVNLRGCNAPCTIS